MRVKDIIDRVTLMYHDETYWRMNQKQYLQLLDDAILQTILLRPDAHEKREIIKLDPGTRQRLPKGAYTLIDIYANKFYIDSLDIYTDGKPIYQVARKSLDYFSNWYSAQEESNEINEFAYDVRTPKDYWVNPPVGNTVPVYVEIGYSYSCEQYSEMEDDYEEILEMEIPISNEFRNALVSYMLYLCYSTDSTSQFDRQIADKYLQNFYQSLNLEYTVGVTMTSRIKEFTTQGIGVHTDEPATIEQINKQ